MKTEEYDSDSLKVTWAYHGHNDDDVLFQVMWESDYEYSDFTMVCDYVQYSLDTEIHGTAWGGRCSVPPSIVL